jgi:hypothetical protein
LSEKVAEFLQRISLIPEASPNVSNSLGLRVTTVNFHEICDEKYFRMCEWHFLRRWEKELGKLNATSLKLNVVTL